MVELSTEMGSDPWAVLGDPDKSVGASMGMTATECLGRTPGTRGPADPEGTKRSKTLSPGICCLLGEMDEDV